MTRKSKPTYKPDPQAGETAPSIRAEQPYLNLVQHYEQCFAAHGPTHRGVDWPNEADLETRFDVMLDIIPASAPDASGTAHLLDLGCGPGLLLDHLAERDHYPFDAYQGIDLSVPMIDAARERHPEAAFLVRDILSDPLPRQSFDYVILNGVLTERRDLSFETMEIFAIEILTAAFAAAREGVAFNVMSPFVDWERDDLFHWPFERMMKALLPLTRHIRIRADYGLREYTTYLYRHAQR